MRIVHDSGIKIIVTGVLRLIAKSAQRRNKLLLLKLASSIQVVNRWNNQILQFRDGTEERKNRRIGF